ncbi:serine/threonine protein phosphatase [Bradyrhizobium sediminis]|uniref:Serine/threonine protein phosphatase n=1 Tax=Bradyrhizobium sediminis TaxID=2840469 RepID=A0A975RX49_9BRAD|nr:metallophosphoesterase family protein [Bradyrhizobium sediminis]QWG23832.1 serine/threonine protein phosphatase [Bradyrhizobium sediminis]
MVYSITFAIGDIHGCFDELESLVAACDLLSEGKNPRFVFVGDYVDRGPDTRKVIDFLMVSQHREPDRFICLRGNHEAMLIDAANKDRSDRDLMNWWANGGEQTLDSYGANDPGEIPADHLAWMKALPLTFSDRKRLYVHAGVRPGVSVADQSEKDLLWIREPFLSCDDDYGALVVHGHTPTKSGLPDLRSNRLNIDTGACFGRPLTAALFTPAQRMPSLYCNNGGEFWRPRSW